jgi:GGDEF domain-containing protein
MARHLRFLRDREDRTESRYEELFDAATRLPRAALLRDRLEMALARASRTRRCVGVLFVDVSVPEDLRGGGRSPIVALPLIAGRLRSAVRPDDTVARVGEYEFVVVCNDLVDEVDLATVVERLESVIAVRIHLDESRSVLTARIESRLGRPTDQAGVLLER